MTNGIRKPHLPEGCCIPFTRPWPGGIAWTHSGYCEHANAKFAQGDAARLKAHNREHMKERHEAKKNPAPFKIHPACQVAAVEGATVCGACSPYVQPTGYDEAHSDDQVEAK